MGCKDLEWTVPYLLWLPFVPTPSHCFWQCFEPGPPPSAAAQGVGMATGKDRAEQAALAATSAPLIQRSVERATGEGLNMHGGAPHCCRGGAAFKPSI